MLLGALTYATSDEKVCTTESILRMMTCYLNMNTMAYEVFDNKATRLHGVSRADHHN